MVNQQLQQIYEDARRIEPQTRTDIETGKLPHQPAPIESFDETTQTVHKRAEFVWATSLRNLQHNTTPDDGVRGTCLMPIKHFAYKAAQLVFRLATAEEVEKQLEHQRKNKIAADADDLKRAKKFEVQLPGGPKA